MEIFELNTLFTTEAWELTGQCGGGIEVGGKFKSEEWE